MMNQSKMNELADRAEQFHDALISHKEKIIINILNSTNNAERQIIRTCYKRLYNHPIQNDLYNNKLSPNFKEICLLMFDTPYEYDAKELHKALHSTVKDDKVIVEIFASRPKSHLNIVDQAYFKFYKISLRNDIENLLTDDYKIFLIAIMDTERPLEQTISGSEAYNCAKLLKEKGVKNIDIEIFKNIFLEKSREDLVLIARAFFELYKKNLYDEIKSEMVGKNKKLIKGVLFATICPAEWFAVKIQKALKNNNNIDINSLNRVLIFRAEIDMYALRDYYFAEKKKDIYTDVSNCTNGSYGEVISNLCLK